MNITEKAAYIKGLADGLDYDKTSAEGKLIAALIDFTGELADYICDLEDAVDELNDYAEELDKDLGGVEEFLMDDADYELEYDDCDCGCDCDDCCDCDDDCECDDDFYEVTCPSCGETICFDESIDPEELTCPACGEKFACDIVEE